jgi:hypothetical protein
MKRLTQSLSVFTLVAGVLCSTVEFSPAIAQTSIQQRSDADITATILAGDKKWRQFDTLRQQLLTAQNARQLIIKLDALIPFSTQTIESQRQTIQAWRAMPVLTQSRAAFLNHMVQIETEKLKTIRGWNKILPIISSSLKAGDINTLNSLETAVNTLDQRMEIHAQQAEQVPQLWQQAKLNNQIELMQMINNSLDVGVQGVVDRGRMSKCMVSSLPVGSNAQVASNPSAYCNAP